MEVALVLMIIRVLLVLKLMVHLVDLVVAAVLTHMVGSKVQL